MRPFERSRPAENDGKGTKGRKACETTRRAVHAMTEVGLGYRAGGEALLLQSAQPARICAMHIGTCLHECSCECHIAARDCL